MLKVLMIYYKEPGGALNPRRSTVVLVLLVIVCIATLVGTIWASYQIASPEGAGGRFWVEWIAIRAKVVDGISPYSITATNRIQNQVGSLFNWIPADKPIYNAPLISAIVTLPFSLLSNATIAHTAWLTVQFVVILLTILAGIRLSGWKPTWWFFSFLVLLILLSVRTMVSWYEGSMTIWVAGLSAGVLLAIQSKRYELAGILLALTMIQPQVVILFVFFVLIWAGSQRRWALIFWFFSTLLFLIVLSVFFVSDWPIQYLRILWNYAKYFAPGTPGIAFRTWWPGMGRQLGWALSAFLGTLLLIEWWLARRSNFHWFLWTACLTLAITPWIGIPVTPDVHILLSLPVIVVVAMYEERWRERGKLVLLAFLGLMFVWEWLLVFSARGDMGSNVRLGLMFPLPLLLLIGLYWVRWWAIRPKRLLVDELRDSENYS